MHRIISFLLIFMAIAANARQISPDEAQSIATEFFGGSNAPKHVRAKSIKRVAPKDATADYQPYYIFNANDNAGFVIISGDDRARKILGYSDKGEFDFSNLPPQLDWLLKEYGKQIESIPVSASQDPSWTSSATPTTEGVVLETANWGQGAPYNAQCPIIDGVQCPTGCVATAMAIVMKYHNWPENYNWDAMPVENNTTENSAEIASLMFEIGGQVKMEYGSQESLGYTGLVPQSLYEHFDYSHTAQAVALGPGHISTDEWEALIKTDIDNHRPIIYNGTGNGSHAFVLDGYDDQNKYHINWGWDGRYNGYYDLSALMPYEGADFSGAEGMVFQISPRITDETIYSKTAYIDYGYLVGLSCFHGLGLNPDTEEIKQNEEFHMSYATLNVRPQTWFGIALMDEHMNIKEVISEEFCSYEQSEDETGFLHYLGEAKATVTVPILESDFLQIVAKETKGSPWLPVRGTLETPSSQPVKHIIPKLTKLNWDVPEDIEICYHHCNTTYSGMPDNIAKGSLLDIYAYAKQEGIVEININGFNNFKDISTWEHGKIGACATTYCLDDEINIEVRFIPESELIDIVIDENTSGDLKNNVSEACEFKKVKSIRVSGEMNKTDFDFIRTNFINLKHIDLSEVNITAIDDCLGNELPAYALNNLPLETIILPKNLEVLKTYSLGNMEKLFNLEIPEKVRLIEDDAMAWDWNLRRIIFKNPTPFVGTELALPGWFNSIGFIVVPKGSFESYSNTPYSNCYNRIMEGDLVPATSIVLESLEDATIVNAYYCSGPYYKVKMTPENSTDYVIASTPDSKIATSDAFVPIDGIYVPDDGIYVNIAGRSAERAQTELTVRSSSGAIFTIPVCSLGKIKSLEINPKEIELKVGDSFQLEADIIPIEYPLTWTSNNGCVQVNESGMVTCIETGESVITVTSNYYGDVVTPIATCLIKVKPVILTTSIEITPASVTDVVGAECQLTATVMPEDATIKAVEWSSDNTEVADVDANGLLKLLSLGTATITASATDGSGVQAQCSVIVDTLSGIEDVLVDANTDVKIYSTTGVLLFEGRYSDAKLAEGIYIVVTPDKQFKRLIK